MGQHKTNPRSQETRPRCGTCPHFYRDQSDMGHCRALPPTAYLAPQQTPMGQVQMVLQSSYPLTRADRWCGAHPDFMVWFSRHRGDAVQIGELETVQVEGAA